MCISGHKYRCHKMLPLKVFFKKCNIMQHCKNLVLVSAFQLILILTYLMCNQFFVQVNEFWFEYLLNVRYKNTYSFYQLPTKAVYNWIVYGITISLTSLSLFKIYCMNWSRSHALDIISGHNENIAC